MYNLTILQWLWYNDSSVNITIAELCVQNSVVAGRAYWI